MDPQHACSFSGHQVEVQGEGHFGKKTLTKNFNLAITSCSFHGFKFNITQGFPKRPQHVCSFSGYLVKGQGPFWKKLQPKLYPSDNPLQPEWISSQHYTVTGKTSY